ncbi:vacuolar protein 14 C-terminal Fig4p binding-domain-containing protein [Boletus reticuloceps]|uniref:Vacuolar protein 14 C-terminal Fig4p binding-domain-containing protein n=1 Tax=Boletus reticuloceps TaxID=495285 RepID=A0A8I2YMD4_9AGAM|nr:vacuolar protein 14 C-terminal Fig4p binding-domain-containing protein [Boletus reticuloceps]
MFSNASNPLHIRNGGLIGLAGTAIALGVDVAPYMDKFIEPVLECFTDPENRIRYFSAECLYNIAKVSKGEVLVYFNPIFDALSKLAADSELSVKNGAELLDRLLKDIVAETASVYIPQYPETERIRSQFESQEQSILVPYPDDSLGNQSPRKAFSLARFIPLLQERIYVVSPFTRSYLVSWITVLDSVPELELVSYLPDFLDGLLKYLSDPTEDVRVATENLLADFLREIRDISTLRHRQEETAELPEQRRADEKLPDISLSHSERALFIRESDITHDHDGEVSEPKSEKDNRSTGAWVPGQGVRIDYAAIIEILIQQLDGQHDEIQQSTALRWLAEFLGFAQEVMLPFTPRLIPAILPNLAHHVPMIQSAAIRTNKLLTKVIQDLPYPVDKTSRQSTIEKTPSSRPFTGSPTPTPAVLPSRQPTLQPGPQRDASSPESMMDGQPSTASDKTTAPQTQKSRSGTTVPGTSEIPSRPQSRTSSVSTSGPPPPAAVAPTLPSPVQEEKDEDEDVFDYVATVNGLTVQFLSEHEQTRVAALQWLIMLHQKAPKKILAMEDGTFPALLKTLSDPSEEVIKHDLQLLAQISSSSEESYFRVFMMNLLELFSTDRKLLEARGSLIIRQLCLNLNTERIYRAFAEILEKEEDLEFASDIVQKLNTILVTSPELAEFRKRLKSLETRQDGQALFTTLYRSWCHNAVSVFSLCLLAQAYEHASNLLSIFADLEMTVAMLVQIDKLVQLIESPVFTYLRLQLLEPERYPYLFKCLYGLLMLLPQSSAFVSLRNRLNAVNSAGFLHIAPKPTIPSISTRSKLGQSEIKWQDLLSHFRAVQAKHEKARRQALGADGLAFAGFDTKTDDGSKPTDGGSGNGPIGPSMRRRVTGADPALQTGPGASGRPALSPLNPRARQNGLLSTATATMGQVTPSFSGSALNATGVSLAMQQQKQRRPGLPVTLSPRKS